MSPIIIILIVIVVLASILIPLLTKKPEKVAEYKKAEFLSLAEKKFFRVLDNTLGGKYRIFIKPRVADLLNSTNFGLMGKIKQKHVDFILCDTNINPVCIIELDDRTHSSKKVIERDTFLNKAFKSAGLPVVHFTVRSSYSNIEIENQIKKVIPDIQQTDVPKT